MKQYKECYFPPSTTKERFETTLLLNCLIGLLVFPFENKSKQVKKPSEIILFEGDSLPLKQLDQGWAVSEFHFGKICDFQGKELKNFLDAPLKLIVYRMRNSIAHSRWEQDEDSNNGLFYDAEDKKDRQGIGIEYATDRIDANKSKITGSVFTDKYKEQLMFKATVSVDGLEKFMLRFAESVLSTAKA